MNRRSFLQSILAAGVAPAVVGSGILMPVRKLIVQEYMIIRPEFQDILANPFSDRPGLRGTQRYYPAYDGKEYFWTTDKSLWIYA